MTDEQIRIFGQILAVNARVLGMQALNMQRAAVGASMAYGDDSFFAEADNLDRLARSL